MNAVPATKRGWSRRRRLKNSEFTLHSIGRFKAPAYRQTTNIGERFIYSSPMAGSSLLIVHNKHTSQARAQPGIFQLLLARKGG